jgi:hypothetical protein
MSKPTHIFLWSYMRPALTHAAIQHALSYNNLIKLVVIIDGLRLKADDYEKNLRQDTVKIVETSALSDNRVELWVYDKNLEILNEHIFRTQERGLELSENGIWVEEDMQPNYEEFSKLVDLYWINSSPFFLSGSSGFNHPNSNLLVRHTLLSPVWLQSLNRLTVEQIKINFHNKKFDESLVKKKLSSVFAGNGIMSKSYLWSIQKFWVSKFESGLYSNSRWDALAAYTFLSQDSPRLVANQNLVTDLGYLSSDGMNLRAKPGPTQSHVFQPKTDNYNHNFCLLCEKAHTRIGKNLLERIENSARYRLSKNQS